MQEKEVINILLNQLKFSSKSISNLKVFVNALLSANKKHNFISKSTESDIWHRHILDSLQLVNSIPKDFQSLMDIGTGAGLPGFIIAIYYDRSGKDIYLVDSNKKKCTFLNYAASKCMVDVKIIPQRVQDIYVNHPFKVDVILSLIHI